MAKKIGIAVAIIIALLLVFVATRSASFRVERHADIAAPAEVVFGMVNDFHRWERWSPFEKLDPTMKKGFEGPASGAGAIYTWSGNDDAGAGRMTIVESRPAERVEIELVFLEPFAATNHTTFTFAPAGDATRVSWIMEGENGFLLKAFSLFMDMNEMVGKDFEEGLANLGAASRAEALQRRTADALE